MFEYEEGGDDGAGDGGAPAGDAAAAEWDGADWSPETLDKQPWRKAIPDTAWSHITKTRERAERAEYLDKLLNADDETVRKDYETTKAERDALKAERDTLSSERDALKKSLGDIEAKSAQAEDDREFERVKTTYADIFADIHPEDPSNPESPLQRKGAWVRFCELLDKGFSEEDAATMARAVMINKPASQGQAGAAAPAEATPAAPAAPPKTRDVKLPPSIAQAGKGGNTPSAVVNAKEAGEGVKQRIKRLGKQWEQEENQPT